MSRLEWLKWRKSGIGSSDAPCIWGVGFRSLEEIYLDKVSDEVKEETSNYILELGNQYEPIARRLFTAIYNMENFTEEEFLSCNVTSPDLDFLIASLDGWSHAKDLTLEIKYQGKDAHNRVADETLPLVVLNETKHGPHGRVPFKYWIQMQHQFLVSGAKKGYFVSYNPKCDVRLSHTFVEADEMFHVEHIKKCVWFWEHVISKVNPFIQTETPKPPRKRRKKNLD